MTNRLPIEALCAFEERHAESQNRPSTNSKLIYRNDPSARTPHKERTTDFEAAQPIQNFKPTLAVQLAAITLLATHLARSKSSSYRVRRDSKTKCGSLYVPQIDWEFHFDALELWCANRALPRVLERQNVLHPATSTLVDIAIKVLGNPLKPVHVSYEEFNTLTDQQLRRNLIAARMREWYAAPTNIARVKAWFQKHQAAKHHFLKKWCEAAQKRQSFLLRADLHYSTPSRVLQRFGPPSHDIVRRDVSNFLAAMQADTSLCDCICIAQPYADFYGGWQIPVAALFSRMEVDEAYAMRQVQKHWEVAAGVTGHSVESSLRSLDGLYRFIPAELAMLDNVENHLVRAATFLYDTGLIADTGIETVSTVAVPPNPVASR